MAMVLALRRRPTGAMHHAHGALGTVGMLAAGPAGAERLDRATCEQGAIFEPQIRLHAGSSFFDPHPMLVGFGQNHRGQGHALSRQRRFDRTPDTGGEVFHRGDRTGEER